MSFDRDRETQNTPAAATQTTRGNAEPSPSSLRGMNLRQQDAQLAPGNQGYAAGAAAYAPVQLRGVGGPGSGKAGAEGGRKSGDKGPKRIERGSFRKVGKQLLFVGYGKEDGAKEQETFLFVSGGQEHEVRIRAVFAHGRCEVYFGDLPEWLWDPSKRLEKRPPVDEKRSGSSDGDDGRIPLVHKPKIGNVKVTGIAPDLRRAKPAEADGTVVTFTLRVVIDGKAQEHELRVGGESGSYRLDVSLNDELERCLGEDLNASLIGDVQRNTLHQLRRSRKLPEAWFGQGR